MWKNTTKYKSYKYSFERMEEAIKAGFYLEAILIEESIISDRLLSVLVKENQIARAELHRLPSFAMLIKKLSSLPEPFEGQADLDSWRKKRNQVAHAIAKSLPGDPPISNAKFRKLAKETANEGKVLCKDIRSWSRIRQNTQAVSVRATP